MTDFHGMSDKSANAYNLDYVLDGRLKSYAHQLQTALAMRPQSALEIGVGPGLISASLRAAGVDAKTLDINPALHPSLVGSVLEIPLGPRSVDVVLCCEVLEHLDLAHFPVALHEMRRVARLGAVLSLPDVSPWLYVKFRFPLLPLRLLSWSPTFFPTRPLPPKGSGKTNHKWEIGYDGASLKKVQQMIGQSGWRIERTWRVPEFEWHRFFDLRPI